MMGHDVAVVSSQRSEYAVVVVEVVRGQGWADESVVYMMLVVDWVDD